MEYGVIQEPTRLKGTVFKRAFKLTANLFYVRKQQEKKTSTKSAKLKKFKGVGKFLFILNAIASSKRNLIGKEREKETSLGLLRGLLGPPVGTLTPLGRLREGFGL